MKSKETKRFKEDESKSRRTISKPKVLKKIESSFVVSFNPIKKINEGLNRHDYLSIKYKQLLQSIIEKHHTPVAINTHYKINLITDPCKIVYFKQPKIKEQKQFQPRLFMYPEYIFINKRFKLKNCQLKPLQKYKDNMSIKYPLVLQDLESCTSTNLSGKKQDQIQILRRNLAYLHHKHQIVNTTPNHTMNYQQSEYYVMTTNKKSKSKNKNKSKSKSRNKSKSHSKRNRLQTQINSQKIVNIKKISIPVSPRKTKLLKSPKK